MNGIQKDVVLSNRCQLKYQIKMAFSMRLKIFIFCKFLELFLSLFLFYFLFLRSFSVLTFIQNKNVNICKTYLKALQKEPKLI